MRAAIARGELELVVVDMQETVLSINVEFSGKACRVTVRCQVYDATAVIENHVYDVAEELRRYISDLTVAFPGAGFNAAEFIKRRFSARPPVIPGIDIELVEVTAASDSNEAQDRAYPLYAIESSLLRSEELQCIRELRAERRRRGDIRSQAEEDAYGIVGALLRSVLSDTAVSTSSVSVWTSGDDGSDIAEALGAIAGEYGLSLEEDGPPVRGSWWQRFKVASRAVANNEVVQQTANEILLRARLEAVAKTKAQVDAINADTITKFIMAVESKDEAVVVAGPAVIIKHQGAIFVRTVDPVTAAKLEGQPLLLTNPGAILEALAKVAGQDAEQEQRPALQSRLAGELERE